MLKNLKNLILTLIAIIVCYNSTFANSSIKEEEIKELFSKKEYSKAISELHNLSVNGDLNATILLAEIFYKGQIVKKI